MKKDDKVPRLAEVKPPRREPQRLLELRKLIERTSTPGEQVLILGDEEEVDIS